MVQYLLIRLPLSVLQGLEVGGVGLESIAGFQMGKIPLDIT